MLNALMSEASTFLNLGTDCLYVFGKMLTHLHVVIKLYFSSIHQSLIYQIDLEGSWLVTNVLYLTLTDDITASIAIFQHF